ncbi:hypothetical protein LWM68_08675 [Niabella sp. W65]|nr:hypothetical protein [Niabella sp. W65]MCH7362837.1 hypothetical protein [Niabella sp. W65]
MRIFWVTIFFILLLLPALKAQSYSPTNLRDTTQLKRELFKIRKLYIPAGLTGLGIALNSNRPESFKNEIAEERNEHLFSFGTTVDNYLQYSPIVIAYGLDALELNQKRIWLIDQPY